MDTKELRRKRKELIEACRGMLSKADAEKRGLTADEDAEYGRRETEIDRLAGEIEREERLAQREAEMRGGQRPLTETGDGSKPKPIFGSLGEQLMAVRAAAMPGATPDQRLLEVRAPLGMNVGQPSDGGFLMEQQYAAGIWKRAYSSGEIVRRCFKVPIGDNADSVKIHGIDETSRATGSRWGGVRAYWVAEAGSMTGSAPKWLDIELAPKKLAVLFYATSELLRNPVALEAMVNQIVPQEIAFMTEDALLNGNGAGKPLGVLAAPALVSVAKEANQGADTIVKENIDKMWSRMWAGSRQNAVWLINQDCEPQLDNMALAVGAGGVPVYLPAGGISETPYARLKGRQVIPVEHCQTVGDLGDIVLADFSQYGLADRGGVEVASSIHVQFLTDESVFRFLYSVDGEPMWNSVLTPAHGSNTLSPFVALAARA